MVFKIKMSNNHSDSRISDYFAKHGFTDGISYEVSDGKLTIYIDSKKHTLNFSTTSSNSYFFIIGNRDDNFWVEEVREHEKTTEYIISHIVQHGPDIEFNKCPSKKISDVFPGVIYTDYITVIVK